MSFYTGGTITVANGATAVTGSGTAFASQVKAGDMLVAAGLTAVVASVESNTGLTLVKGWPGTSLSADADYVVNHTGGGWHSTVVLNEATAALLLALETKGFIVKVGVPTSADGEDDDVAIDVTTFPWQFYVKQSGAWQSGPTTINIVKLTAAEYAALPVKDPDTLYVING